MARRNSFQRRQALIGKHTPNQRMAIPDFIVKSNQQDDLKTAWDMFDTENNGHVFMNTAKNILHNFGFTKTSNREFEKYLQQLDIDSRKPYLDWNELLSLVSLRYHHGGMEDEFRQAFGVFDRK